VRLVVPNTEVLGIFSVQPFWVVRLVQSLGMVGLGLRGRITLGWVVGVVGVRVGLGVRVGIMGVAVVVGRLG
jgi:hypothetical protein